MILVTGGAGFIGGHLVDVLVQHQPVVVVDCLTTASRPFYSPPPGTTFYKLDIRDYSALEQVFEKHTFDQIYHLAAETHVDLSIRSSLDFVSTNVNGTWNLLDLARRFKVRRFLHVSTDEVYGSQLPGESSNELTRYDPRNPYSASKAASDHLVQAWHVTYDLDTVITHCSNNFGPEQDTTKMIPASIKRILSGENIRLYGDGSQIRDWLWVRDHVQALILAMNKAEPGSVYNIGTGVELNNLELCRKICNIMKVPFERIELVTDRPGHDQRYSMDSSRIQKNLNWRFNSNFDELLEITVHWYSQRWKLGLL